METECLEGELGPWVEWILLCYGWGEQFLFCPQQRTVEIGEQNIRKMEWSIEHEIHEKCPFAARDTHTYSVWFLPPSVFIHHILWGSMNYISSQPFVIQCQDELCSTHGQKNHALSAIAVSQENIMCTTHKCNYTVICRGYMAVYHNRLWLAIAEDGFSLTGCCARLTVVGIYGNNINEIFFGETPFFGPFSFSTRDSKYKAIQKSASRWRTANKVQKKNPEHIHPHRNHQSTT